MSIEPLIFAFVFIGVLLMVEGLYLLAFGKSVRQASKVNRRLQLLDKSADPEEVLSQLRKEREQHLGFSSIPIMSPMFANAAKANIAWSPAVISLIMVGCMGAVYVGLTYASSAAPSKGRTAPIHSAPAPARSQTCPARRGLAASGSTLAGISKPSPMRAKVPASGSAISSMISGSASGAQSPARGSAPASASDTCSSSGTSGPKNTSALPKTFCDQGLAPPIFQAATSGACAMAMP